MSLVVADPDEEALVPLCYQLDQLGLEPRAASTLKLAAEMCEHAAPQMLLAGRPEWAHELAALHRSLPVVLLVHGSPDADTLLTALRSGIADVWSLPMADDALRERFDDILQRHRAAASQAEKKLGQYVADLQRDQRAGRYIQMGMLPPNPMAIDRYHFRHRIIPSLILSGDFVDYFSITDRHFAFYVADVSGHGASSAFVTVLLKNFSRRLRREYRPSMLEAPGEILEWFNRELLEQRIDKHVAIVMGIGDLEADTVCLVNAGNLLPAILVSGADREQASAEFIEQKGKPVGLFKDVSYRCEKVHLNAGDRLVVFTDGVLDALGEGNLQHKEGELLRASLVSGHMDETWKALDIDPATECPDDMTCLIVRRES